MIFFNRNSSSLYFLLLTACVFVGCHEKKATPETPPVEVTVEKVEPQTVPAVFEFVGVAQSSHEVEIRARVTGYLEEIAYLEGSFVHKGDLLFQLDPRPFQAALAKERAQVAQEEAVLWQAQRAVKRFKPLYEQKAASQRDLDNAIAQEMSAQALVLAAQAQVADAEINLSYTTISSPVSGQAGQAKYRVGALISPAQDLLTTVSVLDPIWVNFSVSEQDMLQSQQDRSKGRLVFPPEDNFEIELVLADQSLFPERGTVNFASPTYSQKTGTMVIRATLPNPNTILRPGQFVRVKALGATRPNAIVIPQRAVAQSQHGSYVFTVDADSKAQMQPVELGPWDGANWVIYGGLKGGDRVVVDGINKILPGSVVKVKQEVSQADATKTTGTTPQ